MEVRGAPLWAEGCVGRPWEASGVPETSGSVCGGEQEVTEGTGLCWSHQWQLALRLFLYRPRRARPIPQSDCGAVLGKLFRAALTPATGAHRDLRSPLGQEVDVT